MKTFFENVKKIEAHNNRLDESYKQGLTEDSDMTFEEIKAFRSGAKKPDRQKRSPVMCPFKLDRNVSIPNSGCLVHIIVSAKAI